MLLRAAFVLAAAGFAAGCGSSSSGGTGGGSSTTSASTGGPSICADDPRVTAYHAGMVGKATDGGIEVRIVDSDPSPPIRGNNTMTIAVTDKAGTPIEGASIHTKTFMPDHGHGSSIDPSSRADGKPGEYVIDPVNLFMPGVWEITFTVDEKGGSTDDVMFTLCIDG